MTPTPQGISALLKRAGFQRAALEARGRGGHCSGFRVTKNYSGGVRVRHAFLTGGRQDPKPHLARYAAVIESAGWGVDASEYELVVTAKPASILAAKDGD
jgi:hypothetical protein